MAKRKWTNKEIEEYRKVHGRISYFNREDTRVFVPKVFGIGPTLNWANPLSWAVIVVIMAAVVCIRYLFV